MEISTGSKIKHLKERQRSLKAFDFQFEGCFLISLQKTRQSTIDRAFSALESFHLVLKSVS